MSREAMIPLSAVLALIERQEAFTAQIVDKLGLHLEAAAAAYERALNPPLEAQSNAPMTYTPFTDEAEDLYHQIESGIIPVSDVTDNMKRILADADMSIDIK